MRRLAGATNVAWCAALAGRAFLPQNEEMAEFTGERVIPGQVDADLWAEHVARYAFAARFAAGKRVLDLGCGAGYGAAELAKTAAAATGADISEEAIAYARQHYPRLTFRVADARKLPFEVAAFDLITAFELIEHLEDWRAMLHEVRRVLDRAGVFLVSTPNKLYYAQARGQAGPNPYHKHEFEFAEFRGVLSEFFPHVRVLLQDRLESFLFYDPAGAERAEGMIARSAGGAAQANFFVAVCSVRAQAKAPAFVYIPQAANLLRERESHIAKLEGELAQVRKWLEQATVERDQILAKHAEMERHVEEKNRWAAELDGTLRAAQARIVELQDWLAAREREFAAEKARAMEVIAGLETSLKERTDWARKLEARVEELSGRAAALAGQLAMVRESRWLKAGRLVGLGPKLKEG
jgi:SAM-dependent methyltransferase